jgi:hypothetical protein
MSGHIRLSLANLASKLGTTNNKDLIFRNNSTMCRRDSFNSNLRITFNNDMREASLYHFNNHILDGQSFTFLMAKVIIFIINLWKMLTSAFGARDIFT